jgi:PhnB protein
MDTKRVITRTTTVTPYLEVRNASEAIEFYKKAFGAVETFRIDDEEGRVAHAEIHIGDAVIYISDEFPEITDPSARQMENAPVMMVLDVINVDAFFEQAIAAGATIVRPLADSFNGALRTAKLVDPYQHTWMITTHYEIEGQKSEIPAPK